MCYHLDIWRFCEDIDHEKTCAYDHEQAASCNTLPAAKAVVLPSAGGAMWQQFGSDFNNQYLVVSGMIFLVNFVVF